MKSARKLLSIIVVGLLGLGYLASQYAALSSTAPDYAARVDIPQVKYLSLILLIAAIVFACIPDKETDPE